MGITISHIAFMRPDTVPETAVIHPETPSSADVM
jgi:hypothetical protein